MENLRIRPKGRTTLRSLALCTRNDSRDVTVATTVAECELLPEVPRSISCLGMAKAGQVSTNGIMFCKGKKDQKKLDSRDLGRVCKLSISHWVASTYQVPMRLQQLSCEAHIIGRSGATSKLSVSDEWRKIITYNCRRKRTIRKYHLSGSA